jgi:hypothetical protein
MNKTLGFRRFRPLGISICPYEPLHGIAPKLRFNDLKTAVVSARRLRRISNEFPFQQTIDEIRFGIGVTDGNTSVRLRVFTVPRDGQNL